MEDSPQTEESAETGDGGLNQGASGDHCSHFRPHQEHSKLKAVDMSSELHSHFRQRSGGYENPFAHELIDALCREE
jgi:hypothetical protein